MVKLKKAMHSGSISDERLRKTLLEYLDTEGHDISLVDSLFTGVIERVVALVSRVQGTVEFEIQPLREYFAAKHLYENAPASPPGDERHGTRPDIFDSLARNFYWLNVTRFFAGCFGKGELASLVFSLSKLNNDKESDFRYLDHGRLLSSFLLSDWVFAQSPNIQSKVVNGLLDESSLCLIAATDEVTARSESPLILPDAVGGDQIWRTCYDLVKNRDTSVDLRRYLTMVIAQQAPKIELKRRN